MERNLYISKIRDYVDNDKPISGTVAKEWLRGLLEERDKLIEGLRFYADERSYQQSWYGKAGDYTQRASNILIEIES